MYKIFWNMLYLLLKKISGKKPPKNRVQLPVMRTLIQTTKKSMGIFPLFVVRFIFDTVLEKGNYAQSKIPLYTCMCVRAHACVQVHVCVCLFVGG